MTEAATSAAAEVVVRNTQGLHLRPAGLIARMVQGAGCRVTIEADGVAADAASMLELSMLGAVQGTTLRISAEGPGARDAVDGLVRLVAAGFSEQ